MYSKNKPVKQEETNSNIVQLNIPTEKKDSKK